MQDMSLLTMHHPILDLALAWGVVNLFGVLWLAGIRRKCDEVPSRRVAREFRRVTPQSQPVRRSVSKNL